MPDKAYSNGFSVLVKVVFDVPIALDDISITFSYLCVIGALLANLFTYKILNKY